jgi:hypothetical protein
VRDVGDEDRVVPAGQRIGARVGADDLDAVGDGPAATFSRTTERTGSISTSVPDSSGWCWSAATRNEPVPPPTSSSRRWPSSAPLCASACALPEVTASTPAAKIPASSSVSSTFTAVPVRSEWASRAQLA